VLVYALRRILLFIPTLLGISVVVFLSSALAPGDRCVGKLGERASAEQLAACRQSEGLDKSLPVQYGIYLKRALGGDLGISIRDNRAITECLKEYFPATVELAFGALLWAALLGVLLGMLAALRAGSLLDAGLMSGALAGLAMPVFWLGLLLIMLMQRVSPGWPTSWRLDGVTTYVPLTHFVMLDGLLSGNFSLVREAFTHLLLPALALGTIPLAVIARQTRSAMLETLGQDFIRTAWAKGLDPRAVYLKHTLRNSLLPVITIIGLQFGALLSGAILTETIFTWPGMGSFLVEGVLHRDTNAIQGAALTIAVCYMVINLVIDLFYALLDPRVRLA
jgi:peptide/nickel transport system permease protein